MEDKRKLLWASICMGEKTSLFRKVIDYFGTVEELFDCSYEDYVESGLIDNDLAENMVNLKFDNRIESCLAYLLDEKIDISVIDEFSIFKSLRNIKNCPGLLYSRGCKIDNIHKPIAIVGARRCTQYGMEIAYNLAKDLSRNGYTIISGMADGIDTYAHKGAIAGGNETIAVLGCGVDVCYPKSNKKLMKEIVDKGIIISEYPLGMDPRKHYFPIRNRIISGLSMGIVVIEAGEKSGTLITVEHGLEQGKDIFAVPGNIISTVSKGTNKLIKEGAKIVTSVDDILQEYGHIDNKKQNARHLDLSDKEDNILETLRKYEPIHFERLQILCETSTSEFSGYISVLEIKGYIKQLAGKILISNE